MVLLPSTYCVLSMGNAQRAEEALALAVREMTVILGDKANIQETANNVRHYVIMPAISDYIHL